jgi:hypothetical protein
VNVTVGGTEFGTATGFIGKMEKWNWLWEELSLVQRRGLSVKWGSGIGC